MVMGLNSSDMTLWLIEVLGVSFSFLFSFTAAMKYAHNSLHQLVHRFAVWTKQSRSIQATLKLPAGCGVALSQKSFMCFASNIQCIFGILVLRSIYLGMVISRSELTQKMA